MHLYFNKFFKKDTYHAKKPALHDRNTGFIEMFRTSN